MIRFFLPFRWTAGRGMEPLPLLDGHDNGQALGINLWGQIVGVSCAGGDCRGVLWMHGRVLDLGPGCTASWAPSSTRATSTTVGRIGGQFLRSGDGPHHRFRAIPAGWSHGSPATRVEDEP
jgi:hypothetical protein